jgi:hypothetical protein
MADRNQLAHALDTQAASQNNYFSDARRFHLACFVVPLALCLLLWHWQAYSQRVLQLIYKNIHYNKWLDKIQGLRIAFGAYPGGWWADPQIDA